jgi:hypothetical protein
MERKRERREEMHRDIGFFSSIRLDVPTDHVKSYVPEPGWIVGDTEEWLEAEEPLNVLLKELLGAL